MDMEIKIRLLKIMLHEAREERERHTENGNEHTASFHNGYQSALDNVLDILQSDYFTQVMIDYYTKGE